ncbi:hypothetical protein ACCO45_003324 [Purpureocillium lilacinum]|uniref:Uncharacterized protein n=1 Tax=Purpureocillium lilacinum TaxID=33203 RepID=A0ACC4DZJ7_PURLI
MRDAAASHDSCHAVVLRNRTCDAEMTGSIPLHASYASSVACPTPEESLVREHHCPASGQHVRMPPSCVYSACTTPSPRPRITSRYVVLLGRHILYSYTARFDPPSTHMCRERHLTHRQH